MREAGADEPWGVLAILSIIGFLLIGGMLTSLSVYMSLMQPQFGWSEVAMEGGPVLLLLGMSAGNLLVGPVMARFGGRGVFSLGAGLAVCGWIAAGFVRALPDYLGAMGLAGLGIGMATIVPGIAVLSQSFHQRRGLAVALFISSCALASSVMPVAGRWLIDQFGWRQAFWAYGTMAGLICCGALRFLPPGLLAAGHGEPIADQGMDRQQALKLPAFWMLTLVLMISQFCLNAILFTLIAYLRKSGWGAADAVSLYSITNFMSLPGLLIGGALSDRVSARILLPLILVLQAAGSCALLGVGGGGTMSTILFLLCWGGVAGLPAQSGSMLLGEIVGQRAYAAMLGIAFTINGFAGALAPAVMGWAYQRAGGYGEPLLSCASLCLLAALASLLCRGRASNLTLFSGKDHAEQPCL